MIEEKDADAYSCECPKCGHKWKVSKGKWIRLNMVTGKHPDCPKCNSGRILWKPIKDE
ncbi:MAG: hypothetical protein OEY24_04800 [Candidatus Bathyarchaeota archaeon]|nr:hypothetical protein [Candidatus Bathyarchaeota archaeon]MDH5494999.1 hypothetical protein [Candidatus Bathyarchaeota archaeon]